MTKDEIKAKIIDRDMQPSAEALARKDKSNRLLKEKLVPILPSLPNIEDSNSAKTRSKEEIAHRAIALCIVAVKGEGLEQSRIQRLIERYGAQNHFTPCEAEFIECSAPTLQDRTKFSWKYECYWVLLWALGYVDTLDFPNKVCDVAKAVTILNASTAGDFIAKAKLRPKSEILDEADLIYRFDWAAVNARLKKIPAPAGLINGVVMERHRALNWLIGYMNQEWDDVTTDT